MGRGKANVRSGSSFLEHRKHKPSDGLLAQHLKSGAAIRTVSDGPGRSACPVFKAKAKKWPHQPHRLQRPRLRTKQCSVTVIRLQITVTAPLQAGLLAHARMVGCFIYWKSFVVRFVPIIPPPKMLLLFPKIVPLFSIIQACMQDFGWGGSLPSWSGLFRTFNKI